jgi:carbonic anhydrase
MSKITVPHSAALSDAVLSRYAHGNSEHIHRVRDYGPIYEAARIGQRPRYVFYGSGEFNAKEFFGIVPGDCFVVSAFPFVLHSPRRTYRAGYGDSMLAGAFYAEKMLGIQHHVVCITGRDSLLSVIVDGKYHDPLLRMWEGILRHHARVVNSAAKELGLDQERDREEYLRLAALQVLRDNGGKIEDCIGRPVARFFLDFDNHALMLPKGKDLIEDYHLAAATAAEAGEDRDRRIALPDTLSQKVKPEAFICGCCDARAQPGHAFCLHPNEAKIANVISAMVVPYDDVLRSHRRHSVWGPIENALSLGIRKFFDQGHSMCGGVNALINWCLGDAPRYPPHTGDPGPFLNAWLEPAKPIVQAVIKFAEAKKLTVDERARLAEKRVAQWSAQNMRDRIGNRGDVFALYQRIDSRLVEFLDLNASLVDLLKTLKDPVYLTGIVRDDACREYPYRPEDAPSLNRDQRWARQQILSHSVEVHRKGLHPAAA